MHKREFFVCGGKNAANTRQKVIFTVEFTNSRTTRYVMKLLFIYTVLSKPYDRI